MKFQEKKIRRSEKKNSSLRLCLAWRTKFYRILIEIAIASDGLTLGYLEAIVDNSDDIGVSSRGVINHRNEGRIDLVTVSSELHPSEQYNATILKANRGFSEVVPTFSIWSRASAESNQLVRMYRSELSFSSSMDISEWGSGTRSIESFIGKPIAVRFVSLKIQNML